MDRIVEVPKEVVRVVERVVEVPVTRERVVEVDREVEVPGRAALVLRIQDRIGG